MLCVTLRECLRLWARPKGKVHQPMCERRNHNIFFFKAQSTRLHAKRYVILVPKASKKLSETRKHFRHKLLRKKHVPVHSGRCYLKHNHAKRHLCNNCNLACSTSYNAMYPHETLRVLLELHNLPISCSSMPFHRLHDHKQVEHNFVVLVAPIVFSANSHTKIAPSTQGFSRCHQSEQRSESPHMIA